MSSPTPLFVLIVALIALACLSPPSALAEQADEPVYTPEMTHADSVEAWHEATSNYNALDIASDVAGEVVFFPLRVVFTGVREGVRIVNEHHLVERVDDFLSADDGSWRIVPVASPTTGGGAKLKYKPNPEIKANVALTGAWWLYGRQTYRLHAEKWPLAGGLTGMIAGEYHVHPEERFYGIGMVTTASDEMFYRHEQTFTEAGLDFEAARWLEFNAHSHFSANYLDDSPVTPSLQYSAMREARLETPYLPRIDLMSTSLGFEINTSINRARPMNGFIAKATGGYHTQLNETEFGYWDTNILIGKYVQLVYDRVLYVDVGGWFTEPFSDRTIPFFELPELGGTESLRGFRRGRYIGENTVHGTVEYRLPVRTIWDESGFDFSFFADWGKVVQDNVSDWNTDSMQIGYGFSLQTWNQQGSAARLDVGFSREGVHLYFVMGL